MMQGHFKPQFSGHSGDNVNQYIKACRCIPQPYGYTDAQLNEIRAVLLYQGTSGDARSFLDNLPEAVQDDFTQASTKLKGKFPWTPETNQAITMESITNLKQAGMSLSEYIDQGMSLEFQIAPNQLVSLCQYWLLGLNDQLAAHIAITAWVKHADGEMSFDSIVHYVKKPGLKYKEPNSFNVCQLVIRMGS
ncbi:unnamed protein product [Penicillium pancosmium]